MTMVVLDWETLPGQYDKWYAWQTIGEQVAVQVIVSLWKWISNATLQLGLFRIIVEEVPIHGKPIAYL